MGFAPQLSVALRPNGHSLFRPPESLPICVNGESEHNITVWIGTICKVSADSTLRQVGLGLVHIAATLISVFTGE